MNHLVEIIIAGLGDVPVITAEEAVAISRAALARVPGCAPKAAPPALSNYMFVLHGLGREQWVQGADEEAARYNLWRSLSEAERVQLVQVDCVRETAPCILHTFREPKGMGLAA